MPIYEYVCEQCAARVEVLQKVDDPPPERCESCGKEGTLSKAVSRTSFVLKGGGWYSDLYGSTPKPTADTSAKPTSPQTSEKSTPMTTPAPAKSSDGE